MELTAGKVAVVTGAASGIGLALAERFARAGLDVVLADVEETALQAAAQQIASLGVKTLAVPTDVSDEAAVNALAAASVDRFGAVHVVCNNAGVTSRADPWSGPVSAWRWVLGVNLWGVIHGIRAFLPLLTAQGESHIVNTASAAGLIPATCSRLRRGQARRGRCFRRPLPGDEGRGASCRGQRRVPGLGSHRHRPG